MQNWPLLFWRRFTPGDWPPRFTDAISFPSLNVPLKVASPCQKKGKGKKWGREGRKAARKTGKKQRQKTRKEIKTQRHTDASKQEQNWQAENSGAQPLQHEHTRFYCLEPLTQQHYQQQRCQKQQTSKWNFPNQHQHAFKKTMNASIPHSAWPPHEEQTKCNS